MPATDKRSGGGGASHLQTVGVVEGAVGPGGDRIATLASLFPSVGFENLGPVWPDRVPLHVKIVIAAVDAASATDLDQALRRLRSGPAGLYTIVVLRNADVTSTRRLMHEGAADVLLDPVSEPALALSLERLLTRDRATDGKGGGEIVAVLKAGGGVGATALAVQVAAMLAEEAGDVPRVCLADLDLQFGAAAFYLDLADAVTISDCLSAGVALGETPFSTQLAAHRSGVRVLAAPRELTPLEFITPPIVDALFEGLRRNFALSIIDLPSVWTAWTNRALQLADRIVLVTHLSVPHTQLVRRQMAVFNTQLLSDKPLVLVCNAVDSDQRASVSLKAAEKAIGRAFDVVIPADEKLMNAAINQGVPLAAIRRKTKLEKAIGALAGKVSAQALAGLSLGGR
jgi:pilus assembly protein CpaE